MLAVKRDPDVPPPVGHQSPFAEDARGSPLHAWAIRCSTKAKAAVHRAVLAHHRVALPVAAQECLS